MSIKTNVKEFWFHIFVLADCWCCLIHIGMEEIHLEILGLIKTFLWEKCGHLSGSRDFGHYAAKPIAGTVHIITFVNSYIHYYISAQSYEIS